MLGEEESKMIDFKALLIGIAGASIVFMLKERKVVIRFLSTLINYSGNKKMSYKLKRLMDEENLSYEEE